MAKEVAKLKEEADMFRKKVLRDCPQAMSPGARNSRISALETMLATSSSTLVSMASQLSEAEERERVFSGRGRWNQVRSLAEAKNIMNFLFNLVSSSRCQLRDKEVSCREKDSEISELKEKVFRLSGSIRQLEARMKELWNQNLQRLTAEESSNPVAVSSGIHFSSSAEDGHPYALRKVPRTSQFFNLGINNTELLEDMDTSESEQSDSEYDLADEDWVESGKKLAKQRSKSNARQANTDIDNDVENIKTEIPTEEAEPKQNKSEAGLCCSCTRASSCKTRKCECRAARSMCSTSCGCVPSKCTNREDGFIKKEMDETTPSELTECGGEHSSSDNIGDEKGTSLVSRGTMLLQNALADTLARQNQDVHQRKPLSDIGNTAAKPNAPKLSRRKNWRKSVIQLVPIEPLPSSMPDNNEAARARADVPLRLPRAMDSEPFADRNSAKPDESTGSNKDGKGIAPPRSPVNLQKASDDKENQML